MRSCPDCNELFSTHAPYKPKWYWPDRIHLCKFCRALRKVERFGSVCPLEITKEDRELAAIATELKNQRTNTVQTKGTKDEKQS